ncbi:MAG: AraC family transcriptional regulator, partial [Clostridiales bacterium]|nr:AraC family transcriptional regulator [Clostridiales bacterium]
MRRNTLVFNLKMFDADYKVAAVRSAGYETVLRHSHSFVEIVFVKSGEAFHNIGGAKVPIAKGDLFIVATDEEHDIRPICDEKDFLIINVLCDKSVCGGVTFPPSTQIFNAERLLYESLVDKICAEYASDAPSEEILLRYVHSLLHLVGAETLSQKRKSGGRGGKRQSANYYISKATDFIHENYMRPIRLKDIAAAVPVYPDYLQKIFRDNRQTGVVEYLIHYRMEQSSKYLLETGYTVEKISELVGIPDVKNFYSTFKRYFHQLTPG